MPSVKGFSFRVNCSLYVHECTFCNFVTLHTCARGGPTKLHSLVLVASRLACRLILSLRDTLTRERGAIALEAGVTTTIAVVEATSLLGLSSWLTWLAPATRPPSQSESDSVEASLDLFS